MADDVLKSFLVSIGFKVEEAELRRFTGSINSIGQSVAGMSLAYGAMLASVTAGIRKAASELESLYYAGQRVGGSATGLQALGRTASQLGSSFEEAKSSIEGLADRLRNLPGMEGALNKLGIETRDRAGHMRDIVAIQQDLARRLNAMPTSLRHVYSGFFSQNEQFLRAEANSSWGSTYQRERGLAAAIGLTDEDVANATKFNTAIRDLGYTIESISQKASAQFFESYGDQIKQVQGWLQAHSGELIKALTDIGDGILQVAKDVGPMIVKLDEFITGTVGWKTAIEGLAGMLMLRLVPGLTATAAAITRLAAIEIPSWLAALFGIPGAVTGLLAGGALLGSTTGLNAGEDERARQMGTLPPPDTRNWWQRHAPSWLGGKSAPGEPGWWTPERQSHAVDYLMKNGGLTELGAKALVSRWAFVESNGGPTSENNVGGGHYGIAQWSHSRGNSIWGNPDLDAQLALVVKELNTTEGLAKRRLNAARTPEEAALGASSYERAEHYNPLTGRDDFTARTLGGIPKISAPNFNTPPLGINGNTNTWNNSSVTNAPVQNVTMNITGSDAVTVADAANRGLSREWANVVRNFNTAVG